MKIVVYTAIFGSYSGLISQPKLPNVDYVCFTDKPISSKSWDVRIVNLPIKNDLIRSNRYYKILPHLQFKEYEVSIYIDSNFLIIGDIGKLVEDYLKDNNMACFDHNQTFKDKRNCIYEEYEAILALGKRKGKYKDSPEIMKNQIDFFKSEGYPKNNGLIKGGVLIRKHLENDVIKSMEDWWEVISKKSNRDQLSFNYIAWKNNFKYTTINGDIRTGNPWFYMLGDHRKNYWKKMIEYKLKKIFS